jgi:type IX secretion system substrate protein
MRQKKVSGLSIGNPLNPRVKGLLEYTPTTYNPLDPTKTYPVIIYFHGNAAIGQGTTTDLCKILNDGVTAVPNRIESTFFQDSVTLNSQLYSYIVISPQYTTYSYPIDFPSASLCDSVIDYVVANYRVDINRIYLTGMSAGSNIVIEYAGSSVARARRVAAVAVASICSQVGSNPNGLNVGKNIADADLPVWFLTCQTDFGCPPTYSRRWYDSIMANNPDLAARPIHDSLLSPYVFGQDTIYYCRGFGHDTWTAMSHSGFTPPKTGNKNMYNWFIQFARNNLVPVQLRDYSVRLSNGKVIIRWTTLNESNNAGFVVERADQSQSFNEIATIGGSGASQQQRTYEYIDDKPLKDLSFYRLVQRDVDGKKQYYEMRKIINRSSFNRIIISPNPFKHDLSLYLNVDKAQYVSATISDLNGKTVRSQYGTYSEGSTEIRIKTDDLPAGIYFLKVQGKDFNEVHKVIKH